MSGEAGVAELGALQFCSFLHSAGPRAHNTITTAQHTEPVTTWENNRQTVQSRSSVSPHFSKCKKHTSFEAGTHKLKQLPTQMWICSELTVHANKFWYTFTYANLSLEIRRGIETVSTLMQKLNKFTHNQWQDEQSTFYLSMCLFYWHLSPSAGLLKQLSSRKENKTDWATLRFSLYFWSYSITLVSFILCVLVFPQLCLLSTVPLWSETTELSLWKQRCGLERKSPNSGKSDWATLYLLFSEHKKTKMSLN